MPLRPKTLEQHGHLALDPVEKEIMRSIRCSSFEPFRPRANAKATQVFGAGEEGTQRCTA